MSVYNMLEGYMNLISICFRAAYAWDEVQRDAIICDVGDGNGHAMLGLIKEYPHIKVVLQDLPAVIQQGKDVSQNAYSLSPPG